MNKVVRKVNLSGVVVRRKKVWSEKPVIAEHQDSTPAAPVFTYEKPQKKSWRAWPWRKLAGGGGALVAAIVVFFGLKILFATNKIITRNATGSAPALAGSIDPTKLKGEGDGRVNILLMGIGGTGHDGPYLSDTMMIASIDPQTKDVALLSVPRDLWVSIPGYGSAKINAADSYGEAYRYPGGGGALAKNTVSKVLDIPIHYYVRVSFNGFKQGVDSVGGVDINVDKALYDPLFPLGETGRTKTVNISTGLHHMDGNLALDFARSRETTSDFDRAHRQQLVLLALRQKALSIGTLTNPAKLLGLINTAGDNVKTDLQPGEIQKLASIAKDIDQSKVQQKVLDTSPNGFLTDSNIGGGYVELPKSGNWDDIRNFVHSFFADNYIKNENASIEVQNGTKRSGLAGTVAAVLKGYNYNVTKVTTAANQNYPSTILYDCTGGKKPYTIHYLENRFGVKAQKATPPSDGSGTDIKIIVGANYHTSQSTASSP